MSLIYEPKGKAREYSPLALNIYTGCDHRCKYCYVKCIIGDAQNPKPRKDILIGLKNELSKTTIKNQVLLCFMSDPYCNLEMKLGLTRNVLKILVENNIPAAILTKGGNRILRDMDIIKQHSCIKIGATLTFDNKKDSLEWEPGAALPEERIEMLREIHNNGIKTFVSFEPVIEPEQSLNLIKKTLPFVDQYKIGKWNHDKRANEINWKDFGNKAVSILRQSGKEFYIKKDLAVFLDSLTTKETDFDYLALRI